MIDLLPGKHWGTRELVAEEASLEGAYYSREYDSKIQSFPDMK